MSLHQILETLIHHTTFRTEDERHQLLDLLDDHVDRAEPLSDSSIARTDWRPKIALGPTGVPVPTGMTSAQADELISLLKAQVLRNVLKGENETIPGENETIPPADAPAPLPPPVTPADVPPGVT